MLSEGLHKIESGLEKFPSALLQEFQRAVLLVQRRLGAADLYLWGKEGLALAQQSPRSWEAAMDYFRASPEVLRTLDFPQFISWGQSGQELAQSSSSLASAYFRSSPEALHQLPLGSLGEWSGLGRRLYRETWRSGVLASRFFEVSPQLLRSSDLSEVEALVRFLDLLAVYSYDLATDCLNSAPEILGGLEKADRSALLDAVCRLVEVNPRDSRRCFQAAPRALAQIQREKRPHFLRLAGRIAGTSPGECLPFFQEVSKALGQVDWDTHSHLLDLAEELVAFSPVVAREFLKVCPMILARIRFQDLEVWFREGVRLLGGSLEAGLSYFKLESASAGKILEDLACGVELEGISEVLRLYCRALTGKDLLILPSQELVGKNLGWASPDKPATEGTSIFLPPLVRKYPDKVENFAWDKVAATHQAAHMEFGSFDFSFDQPASLFPNLRQELEQAQEVPQPSLTSFQRFFNLFSERKLASEAFLVLEDTRVDHLVKQEYKGLRPLYLRIQMDSQEVRPDILSLPMREAVLENLVRLSLGKPRGLMVPNLARVVMGRAIRLQASLVAPGVTVEDTAEASIRLYRLLTSISNLTVPPEEWESLDSEDIPMEEGAGEGEGEGLEGQAGPQEEGEEFTPLPEVEFRGEFKPELVQTLQRLEQQGTVSAQDLKDALEQSAELDKAVEVPTEQVASSLMREATRRQKALVSTAMSQEVNFDPLERDEPLSFLYDEWDFRAGDYKPRWCRVRQRVMEEGSADFFDKTLKEHHRLAAQVRKQFENLVPELFRKQKRLPDGEEYELDLVIEAVVDRRAGQTPSEKLYWRRNKIERDVAMAFLLDMSASTAENVDEREGQAFRRWLAPGDPLSGASGPQEAPVRPSNKRIIDVEKESTVLLIQALEAIGDAYGIYGFSGYGRENVEFYVIKELGELFSERVKRRLDKIAPLQATRMGPAIRHATAKLHAHEAKTRILFLLSDGRPQDHGYSRDGAEKDYAIHDTRMALLEAKQKDIIPFCITVDRAGHDYLKTMCSDMGYQVVDDIQALPRRLPALYRRLTT